MVTVTLGPLTTIATAVLKAPDIAPRMQDIVPMRGAGFEGGTIPPAAGFTICVDPEAAQIVFAVGPPLVVMPPDVTPKALTPRAGWRRCGAYAPPSARPSPPGPMSSNASTLPDTAATAPPCTTLA